MNYNTYTGKNYSYDLKAACMELKDVNESYESYRKVKMRYDVAKVEPNETKQSNSGCSDVYWF